MKGICFTRRHDWRRCDLYRSGQHCSHQILWVGSYSNLKLLYWRIEEWHLDQGVAGEKVECSEHFFGNVLGCCTRFFYLLCLCDNTDVLFETFHFREKKACTLKFRVFQILFNLRGETRWRTHPSRQRLVKCDPVQRAGTRAIRSYLKMWNLNVQMDF